MLNLVFTNKLNSPAHFSQGCKCTENYPNGQTFFIFVLMKQTIIILSLLFDVAIVLAFTACEPEPADPEISLSPEELLFTSDGGSGAVTLTANCNWEASFPDDLFFTLTPYKGNGNSKIQISVPPFEGIEDRGFVVHFTGESSGQIAMATLKINQLAKPGWASFSDVEAFDDLTGKQLPPGRLSPYRGSFGMNVTANSEWTLNSDPPVMSIMIERGWEGVTYNYVYYAANVTGHDIEYHFNLDCRTSSGGGGDTLVMVQPPSEGSITVLDIPGSVDGQTIPASGAAVKLLVKANTSWILRCDLDVRQGGGNDRPDGKEYYFFIPACDEPEGRTIHFWLLLSDILETAPIELFQLPN